MVIGIKHAITRSDRRPSTLVVAGSQRGGDKTDAVQAVTAADIRRAFGRVLQPDRMVSVVVGGP
jgi:predicted Zn-dependent peptidase